MSKHIVLVKAAFYQPRGRSKYRAANYKYVKYIADEFSPDLRLGGPGFFGPEGNLPDWREIARELAHHDLPVWRLVVSLREEDALNLGFVKQDKWEAAIREGVRNAAERMGLNPKYVRWAAAYHPEQRHPHCHVLMWESPHPGARRRGRLGKGELKAIWRAFRKEFLAEKRWELKLKRWADEAALRLAHLGEEFLREHQKRNYMQN